MAVEIRELAIAYTEGSESLAGEDLDQLEQVEIREDLDVNTEITDVCGDRVDGGIHPFTATAKAMCCHGLEAPL